MGGYFHDKCLSGETASICREGDFYLVKPAEMQYDTIGFETDIDIGD